MKFCKKQRGFVAPWQLWVHSDTMKPPVRGITPFHGCLNARIRFCIAVVPPMAYRRGADIRHYRPNVVVCKLLCLKGRPLLCRVKTHDLRGNSRPILQRANARSSSNRSQAAQASRIEREIPLDPTTPTRQPTLRAPSSPDIPFCDPRHGRSCRIAAAIRRLENETTSRPRPPLHHGRATTASVATIRDAHARDDDPRRSECLVVLVGFGRACRQWEQRWHSQAPGRRPRRRAITVQGPGQAGSRQGLVQ